MTKFRHIATWIFGLVLFSQPIFSQSIWNAQSSNEGLRFIDEIELTPKATQAQSAHWRQEGVATYASGSEIVPKTSAFKKSISIEQCSAIRFKYAQLLDLPVEMMNWDESWFEFLETWIGTPYHYGGSSLRGTDCSGFSGNFYNNLLGIKLNRTARDQANQCANVSVDSLQSGDLVFFRNGLHISHVGVFLGNGYFVHASCSQGVTISHLQETYYKKRFYRAGRFNVEPDWVKSESKKQDAL
jgi:cell wall-associated NlpC family hydrolase